MSEEREQLTPAEQARKIRGFWDERAEKFGTSQRATLGETYLRHVEIKSMLARLQRRSPKRVLDVGCGNGYSTGIYAKALPHTEFVGVDFSEGMLGMAQQDKPGNVIFQWADVTDLSTLAAGPFDVVYTQRCIQNLPDYDTQRGAIDNLLSLCAPGGVLILNECSRVGVQQLNGLRGRLGLKPIEGIEPWHNCFMIDQQLIDDYGARVEYISSTYMFLAKIIHKRLAKYAKHLPSFGRFGYDRFYVIQPRPQASAPAAAPPSIAA